MTLVLRYHSSDVRRVGRRRARKVERRNRRGGHGMIFEDDLDRNDFGRNEITSRKVRMLRKMWSMGEAWMETRK